MAGDLVPGCGDPAHERWIPVGQPAHDDEGPRDPMAGQQLEQQISAGVHPAGLTLPISPGNEGLEGVDVEVLFDVHGESMCLAQEPAP